MKLILQGLQIRTRNGNHCLNKEPRKGKKPLHHSHGALDEAGLVGYFSLRKVVLWQIVFGKWDVGISHNLYHDIKQN